MSSCNITSRVSERCLGLRPLHRGKLHHHRVVRPASGDQTLTEGTRYLLLHLTAGFALEQQCTAFRERCSASPPLISGTHRGHHAWYRAEHRVTHLMQSQRARPHHYSLSVSQPSNHATACVTGAAGRSGPHAVDYRYLCVHVHVHLGHLHLAPRSEHERRPRRPLTTGAVTFRLAVFILPTPPPTPPPSLRLQGLVMPGSARDQTAQAAAAITAAYKDGVRKSAAAYR